MTISQTIRDFITLSIQSGGWMEMDRLYLENRVCALIGETAMEKSVVREVSEQAVPLADALVLKAEENEKISNKEKEVLMAQLLDFMTPPPSVVNAYFAQFYSKDPVYATDYFLKICTDNGVIQQRKTAHSFTVETAYGKMLFLKNLDVAKKTSADSTYPETLFSMTNEGYKGRADYPARTNYRVIRMNLDGESWGFTYLPENRYNEQFVIVPENTISLSAEEKLNRLIRIIEILPHYFVGTAKTVDGVECFEGGRGETPLAKAPLKDEYTLAGFTDIKAGVVDWPLSVIRLSGKNTKMLVAATLHIQQSLGEQAAPIVRWNKEVITLDLVLMKQEASSKASKQDSLELASIMGFGTFDELPEENAEQVKAAVAKEFVEELQQHAVFETEEQGFAALAPFIES